MPPFFRHDLLKLVMQHGTDPNLGSKDEEGGGPCWNQEANQTWGLYDKPLPFFGCGISQVSFVAGFICPPFWYYATVLYFGNYYHPKGPRQRAGLAASATAALISTVIVLVSLLTLLVPRSH